MASPTDSARQGTNVTTAATTHNVNVGSPVAGTLLIVFSHFAAAPGTVTFTGYTNIAIDATDAADDSTQVFYRWADGAEGVSDVCSPANSVKGAHICWEITGAEDPATTAPKISAVVIGTTTLNTANSGTVTVESPPRDALFISMCGGDGEVGAYTAVPANYANLATANSSTAGQPATNCFIGGASRQILAATSDDPGVFTHAVHTNGWTGFTVAIVEPHAFPRNPAGFFPDVATF